MKPDLRRIQPFILIAFFCAMSTVCKSQIEELVPTDASVQEEESPSYQTDENEFKFISVSENDSAQNVKAPSPKVKSHAESSRSEKVKDESEEDDSILSFNFIYYIIRKFKFSDIIDR